MDELEIGYIMGLVVGEGCFAGHASGWGPYLTISLHARDPEPLLHVQRLLGGAIYGPYDHNGRVFRRGRRRAEACT